MDLRAWQEAKIIYSTSVLVYLGNNSSPIKHAILANTSPGVCKHTDGSLRPMADPGLLQRLSAAPRCRVDIHRPAAPTLLFPNKILIRVGLPYDPAEGTVNTGNKMCSNAAFNKIFYTWHTTHQATPELSHIFEKLASWIIDKNPKLVIWNKQYFIDIMKHLNLNLNLNRNLNLKSYFPVDQGCPHLVEILITAFQHYWHFLGQI